MTISGKIYNFALLAGTAYLVGWYGWSPWWFLLTIFCLVNGVPDIKDDE
jgi:hypothetical protein